MGTKGLKYVFGTALAVAPAAAAPAAPRVIEPFYCPPCPVQSKSPSLHEKGKYDYKLKCTDTQTGNSAVISVVAGNDKEALQIAWRSPRLDEIVVGMEANSYACAEPPPRAK
jgi:hypothetical protein